MKMVIQERKNQAITLELSGNVDMHDAHIMQQEINGCLQAGHRYFRIDLSYCHRLDPGLIDVFKGLYSQIRHCLGGVHFIAPQKSLFFHLQSEGLPVSIHGLGVGAY